MSFFTEKARCPECRNTMVTVTAAMEQLRERILAENPTAEVDFVCQTCERGLVGDEAFEAEQRRHRGMN